MPSVAVVGSGPNGLAAAVTLAVAGIDVVVYEAEQTIGGGARTIEALESGARHDWGSAVHPMAIASPFFRAFGLARRVSFSTPELSYAQAMPGGAALAWRSLERTAEGLGADGARWGRMLRPLVEARDELLDTVLRPVLPPRHPLVMARLGVTALRHGTMLARSAFTGQAASALLAGVAAHASGPQPSIPSAATGLVLAALAHGDGWPIPIGGSQAIVDALVAELLAHGGRIETGRRVASVAELGDVDAVVLDVPLAALPDLVAEALLPDRALRALDRYVADHGRPGNGLCKVDYVLSEPVPWADARLADAGTVHLGGTAADVRVAEATVSAGGVARHPYVLVSQPSRFDPTRAPAGRHVLWAYAHVPHGSTVDAEPMVTAHLERYAPGFRDTILAGRATPAAALEAADATLVGGDIGGGMPSIRGLLARPVVGRHPWRTPAPGVYLCSAATVPGPGVHGMAGHQAARTLLRDRFGVEFDEALLAPRTRVA